MLEIQNLSVWANEKKILNRVSLKLRKGLTAIIGPNGSGKSTLARAIMGDPSLKLEGEIVFNGKRIETLSPEKRAELGIFLSFQNPPELESIKTHYFLSNIFDTWEGEAEKLGINPELFSKDLFVGFSGGEKKKFELLQAVLSKPKLAIFDEIDSGLDIDSLRMADKVIQNLISQDASVLAITHYSRIFQNISPDKVYVLVNGRIREEGDKSLLELANAEGFKRWL